MTRMHPNTRPYVITPATRFNLPAWWVGKPIHSLRVHTILANIYPHLTHKKD